MRLLFVAFILKLLTTCILAPPPPPPSSPGSSPPKSPGGAGQPGGGPCLPGWTHYAPRKKCFLVQHDAAIRGFPAHGMHCQRRAPMTTLASVHDAKELHFVANLARKTGEDWAWIGLTQIGLDESTWQWVDNTAMDFKNWARGQPDNFHGTQHCMRMRLDDKAQWDDIECGVAAIAVSVCQLRST